MVRGEHVTAGSGLFERGPQAEDTGATASSSKVVDRPEEGQSRAKLNDLD